MLRLSKHDIVIYEEFLVKTKETDYCLGAHGRGD